MSPSDGEPGPAGSATSHVDLYAVGLSILCLIHCLALPALVVLLPLAAQLSDNPFVHRLLVLLAVPVSLWAIRRAAAVDGSGPFMGVALTGLGLLLVAAFAGLAPAYEESLTVAGALLLGAAHLWRWRRYRGKYPVRQI